MIFGVIVSGALYTSVREANQRTLTERFHDVTHELGNDIITHLNGYERGLRGARGAIFAMGAKTSREYFHQYAASQNFTHDFPGTRGFGFIRRVAPDDLPAFLATARADAAPDFSLKQLKPHDGDLFIIQYIEARDEE